MRKNTLNLGNYDAKFKFKFTAIFLIFTISILGSFEFFGASKDVEQYKNFFESIDSAYAGRFEPFFVAFTLFVKFFSDSFSLYLFLIIYFSLYIKFKILSKFRFLLINFFIYFLLLFSLHELTQYRIAIALGFLYFSFYLKIADAGSRRSYLFFLTAVLFHYSSAAFLPLFLILGFRGKRLTFGWFSIIFFGFSLFLLKDIIYNYVASVNSTLGGGEFIDANIFSSRNIILFLVLVIGLLSWDVMDNKIKPFWFISLYGFILWFIFIDVPVFAHRLFEMTFFSYLIWMTSLRGIFVFFTYCLMLLLGFYLVYKQIFLDPLFS